jgi:hypothetical protein
VIPNPIPQTKSDEASGTDDWLSVMPSENITLTYPSPSQEMAVQEVADETIAKPTT